MKRRKLVSILLILMISISCVFGSRVIIEAEVVDSINLMTAEEGQLFDLETSDNTDIVNAETISLETEAEISNGQYSAASLKSYDPRPKKLMTPVKTQGANGVCWAFAANAVLESAVSYKTGLKKTYSEEHMRFILSNKLAEKNNDIFENGYYQREATAGGQCLYSFIYYTNWNTPILNKQNIEWSAPVYDSDVPYNTSFSNDWPTGMENAAGRIFVTDTKKVDVTEIKDTVLNHGGVCVNIKLDTSSQSFNSATAAMFTNSAEIDVNHSVAIVGWDDNFSRTNFVSSKRPVKDGAWLAKNSHGKNFGDGGYFWISYEEKSICDYLAITGVEAVDKNKKILSYDFAQMNTPIEYSFESDSSMYIANLYDTSNLSGTYGEISQVMFYSSSIGSTYEVYVVPVSNGVIPPISTIESQNANAWGVITDEGYHTIDIQQVVLPRNTQQYAIILRMNTYDEYGKKTLYLEAEGSRSGLVRGQSFINPGDSWEDLVDYKGSNISTIFKGNFSIRPVLTKRNATRGVAALSNTTATYIGSDLSTSMTLNNTELYSIKKGNTVLHEDVDFTLNGNTVTFEKEFLSTLPTNASNEITFHFTNGAFAKVFTVNTQSTGVLTAKVTGIPAVGRQLKAEYVLPSHLSGSNVTFMWQRSADAKIWSYIQNATSSTYTPTSDDLSKYIRVAVMANSANMTYANVATRIVRLGDTNMDNRVSMVDVLAVQKFVAFLTSFSAEEKIAADVNFDTKINMADVILIQKHVAGIILRF